MTEEYDDFFGINEIRSEISKCEYCGKNISLMPFIVNDKHFCDVVCCKLYGDDHSWRKYQYDKHIYDLYYKNQLLSPMAMITYQLLRKIDIPYLPHYQDIDTNESMEMRKNKYINTLVSYITYVY